MSGGRRWDGTGWDGRDGTNDDFILPEPCD